jgi:hypothetical protein
MSEASEVVMKRASTLRISIAALALVWGSLAEAADCPTLLHLHGYLTVAGAKCGYREAEEIFKSASACRTQIGHAEATRQAADGIRFARGEIVVKGGTAAWCGYVKGKYPSLVGGASRSR